MGTPSLLDAATPGPSPDGPSIDSAGTAPRRLTDLFHPGFYMVLLLRNGYAPTDGPLYRERLRQLLLQIDRAARKLQIEPEDVHHAKFAFSALVDEIVLVSRLPIRNDWERNPLQLEMFGEHMAGDTFFDALERLRGEGAGRVQVLEVFHLCLLLGFQGRYALEGTEKLSWLTARLGDEIVHLRGKRSAFAPHWAPPDRIVHKLRSEVPAWVIASLFALALLVAFMGLRSRLERHTEESLATHTDIVRLAPQPAYVTITWP